MKLKLKLAIDAVNARDLIDNEHRNIYGEGFLAGFDEAMKIAKKARRMKEEIKDETKTKIIIKRVPFGVS